VSRPLAAARWFTHANDVHPDAVLVMVEAEDGRVVVTAVRSGSAGLAIAWPSAGYAATGTASSVDAVVAAVAAWGLAPREIDVAVIVGGAAWLPGLPEGIAAATGLAALVDREPLAAAACGAALLVREPASHLGAAVAIGVPLAGTALLASPEGGAVGGSAVAAAAGQALGGAAEGTGVAAAAGQALGGEAEGGGVAAAAGQALGGAAEGTGVAAAAGTAMRRVKHQPPKHRPAKRPSRKLWRPKAALLLAPLAVTLGLGALGLRACVRDDATADLVTAAAPGDPTDPTGSTTTIGSRAGSVGAGRPKGTPGQPVPASDAPTTTTSRRTTTTATPRRPGTMPPPAVVTPSPATPAPPAPPPPDVPPSVTNLASAADTISADASASVFSGGCEDLTTELSASVSDSSGLASAQVTWSTPNGHGGTIDMAPAGGDVWTATLGPVEDTQMTTFDSTMISWSVTAVDPAGHSQTVAAGPGADVTLFGCIVPPIG
jgi:hypothetical protein